jgi:hypothetical protein
MDTLLSYLKQPSTWKGITGLIAVFGIVLSPEQSAGIITAGVSVVATIELFRNEDK